VTTSYCHPTAIVAGNIGAGTRVWAFSNVVEGAVIGSNCNVGDHCFIESGASIGDDVTIKNGNAIWDGVHLEDGVFVGPSVSFTNDLFPRSPRLDEARDRYRDREWLVPTIIRRGASLGAGAIIVCGVTIGEFALVAAGAVVTRDVPAYGLVAGNPAKRKGWVCPCGERLLIQENLAACGRCARRFEILGETVSPIADPQGSLVYFACLGCSGPIPGPTVAADRHTVWCQDCSAPTLGGSLHVPGGRLLGVK
jgi:UDP-2-acetamido-3-amino-2,3-dideoxy-glucuronate N-acetyltransferase